MLLQLGCFATIVYCSELDEQTVTIDDEMSVRIWLLPMTWEYSLMVERIVCWPVFCASSLQSAVVEIVFVLVCVHS